MIILIISFLLDILVSKFITYNSLLYPLFSILSLIFIYPNFHKTNHYYIYSFILGFLYDILIDTIFLNAFIFLLLSYLLKLIFKKIPYNYLSVLLISIFTIIYYRLIIYSILIFINYLKFDIFILLKSISSSLLLNIIYISIMYLITSKKLIFKKI